MDRHEPDQVLVKYRNFFKIEESQTQSAMEEHIAKIKAFNDFLGKSNGIVEKAKNELEVMAK
jgi:hypothetical protein